MTLAAVVSAQVPEIITGPRPQARVIDETGTLSADERATIERLAISIRDTTKAFLAEQRLTLDPWADPDGMTRMIFSEQFGFSAYPTTYLIGPDRRIRAVWTGFRGRDEAEMAAAVVEALKTLPGSAAPAAAVAR
jgi:peroxiredoxin